MEWSSIRSVVYRFHAPVCVHVAFSDIKTLPVLSKLWKKNVQNDLVRTMTEYHSFKASSTQQTN